MNVGYSDSTLSKQCMIDDANCPICGSNIYVSKYHNDLRCTNKECVLYEHTLVELTNKLYNLKDLLFQYISLDKMKG
jgi:NAD-dependent DNA ligase